MIQTDKKLHIMAGWIIASCFEAPIISFIAAIVIGVGKELIWDKLFNKGVPEWNDAWATIGGAIAYLLTIEIKYILYETI